MANGAFDRFTAPHSNPEAGLSVILQPALKGCLGLMVYGSEEIQEGSLESPPNRS